ncbi:MAG: insulinase family protein [Acidobacteriaceae bacterium]|jgi:zinc protease|nr:insulinase family protein [Acidobacteriaceae bacterium]
MPYRLLRSRAVATYAVLLLLAAAGPAAAQTPAGRETTVASVAGYALTQQMPVDPEVLVGGLPNGLRFYVRPNAKPARQVELRLVVKAGSVLEDDDQRGFAHFIEHMQFEGTRHFPGQTIEASLGALGVSIGADANAVTSFDETQYILRVPTDTPGAIDRALTVFEDWAGGALFPQEGIDRQRSIVLAEWRMNLGASERTADKLRKVQLEGSRYADRSPIGNPDVIQSATREQLLRFYRDWYRPDLMAVIVVGDVDRTQIAEMIRRHFGPLQNPANERPRPVFDVPEHEDPRYVILRDRETTSTAVRVSNLRPARNQGTVGGYREIVRDQIFASMLGDRLTEVAQSANPPYLDAAADRYLFPAPNTRDEAVLQALVTNDGVTRGLDALVTELERVQRFGFTASEFDRARQANMAISERVVAESPDRESESRADEYIRNFMQDEALPTIWQELAFHRRFLPEMTLAEMNALAADWFPQRNRLIVVFAPDAATVVLPTEDRLAAAVKEASARHLDPYVDSVSGQALLDTPPAKGTVARTTARPGGITEWTLSNGATVVLKPTSLKADQILFRAFASGGTSLASDADFTPARVADNVIPAGGVGSFTAVALDRLLTGKAAVARPFIGENSQGMSGGSAPADLEALFQQIYLRFTAPRADATAFAALKAQALAALENQSASPDVAFNQALSSALSGNNPRRQPETADTVARWDLEKSLAFYKARFADAGNFTFVFVGSFTEDQIRPFVETYLASLPARPQHERSRDLGIRAPRGVIEKTVQKGIAPRSEVGIVFSGPIQYDDATLLALRAATLVLASRLNDAIRQELGGTYDISATSVVSRTPPPEYRIRIDWTSDPARVESLVSRVFEEIEFVRSTLLTPDQMDRVRDALTRDLDRNSQDNAYLLNQIVGKYRDGDVATLASVFQQPQQSAMLSGYAVQIAAQRYLDLKNYVRVTLMPEAQGK